MSEENICVDTLVTEDMTEKELFEYAKYLEYRKEELLNINSYLQEQLQQKEKEIQDLKQKNDYLNDLEASAVEYKELKDQLQQKENIIKEVREYIELGLANEEEAEELLEILDKGE